MVPAVMTRASMVAIGLLILASAGAPEWEHVAQLGAVNTVYVDPARIEDKALLARIVADLLAKSGTQRPLQIDFFEDRQKTPTALPYTAEQRRHQRAKFNFIPNGSVKRFAWVEPSDPNQPGGKQRLREEPLPLP